MIKFKVTVRNKDNVLETQISTPIEQGAKPCKMERAMALNLKRVLDDELKRVGEKIQIEQLKKAV